MEIDSAYFSVLKVKLLTKCGGVSPRCTTELSVICTSHGIARDWTWNDQLALHIPTLSYFFSQNTSHKSDVFYLSLFMFLLIH